MMMKALSAKKILHVPGQEHLLGSPYKLLGYERFYKFDIYPHYLLTPDEEK